MHRTTRNLVGLMLACAALSAAASWTTGQAARAVIGQSSFSAHSGTLEPIGFSLSDQQLHVADASGQVISFDLGAVLSGQMNGSCAVCTTVVASTVAQAVPSSQARFARYKQAVAVVDANNRQVLFWRNSSLPTAQNGPDVVVDQTSISSPVSVALDAQYLYVGDSAAHRVAIWRLASLKTNQTPDFYLGQPDSQGVSAATIASPAALLSAGGNLFVADAQNHRILVFTPGDDLLRGDQVFSTASQEKIPLAPGSLITLRGEHLAEHSDAAIDNGRDAMPLRLADTELLIDGHPIPLMAVSPKEIRAQVPYSMTYAANVSMALRHAGAQVSLPIAVPVQSVSPAIFSMGVDSKVRAALALHARGEEQSGSPVTNEDPAAAGETLAVWAAGLGVVSSDDGGPVAAGKPNEEALPVSAQIDAFIDGEPAEVVSAILPHGSIGVYEVRIQMPSKTPTSATVQLRLREANAQSNLVSLPMAAAESTIHN